MTQRRTRLGLTLRLDFNSRQPAYLQIVRQVAQRAINQRLRPGQRLPPVRALALQLGLNFNTVARAYRVLQQRGVLSTQRGRGTYVTRRTPKSPAARGQALRSLAREYVDSARWHRFSDAEIQTALDRMLKGRGART
jgi:GntR family transcriptional regulator